MTRIAKVTGRTYPAGHIMKRIGGTWDATNKAWMVDAEKLEEELSKINRPAWGRGEQKAIEGIKVEIIEQ